jgi:hypothetical protein
MSVAIAVRAPPATRASPSRRHGAVDDDADSDAAEPHPDAIAATAMAHHIDLMLPMTFRDGRRFPTDRSIARRTTETSLHRAEQYEQASGRLWDAVGRNPATPDTPTVATVV